MLKDKIRPNTKVYGPYTRKDKRQHVVLITGNKRRTISYPKWLMEQHLGYELKKEDTVDHKNRDFTDNRIENLQVLKRSKHTSKDAKRVKKVCITCVYCGGKAWKKAKDINHNAKQGKAGPFCSKKCSGKYGAELQNGRQEKLSVQKEIPVKDRKYYYEEEQ